MKLLSLQMSAYIQKEVEQLQEKLSPFTKKVSRYMFWSLPLIAVSVFNLGFMLFTDPVTREALPMLGIYALIGAIGMALSRETKLKRKEIRKVGAEYAIERIQKVKWSLHIVKKNTLSELKHSRLHDGSFYPVLKRGRK